MRIIKNINNNYAVALDNAGNQLIVSGKGIGFGEVPRELKDITVINRSFYDVDEMYITMINAIPDEIIDISTKIIDKTRMEIDNPISSNIIFTLADHINFSIQRYKKNMNFKLPIVYEIRNLFEKEMKIGEYGLKLIWDNLKIYLPKEEAAYIALHIINAEEQNKNRQREQDERVIDEITNIIEEEFHLKINKDDFNYSRFVSHLHYLLKRGRVHELIETDNKQIYQELCTEYEQCHQCAEKISAYLAHSINLDLTDEEKLYLMLHTNRLCTRRDCNQ